MTKHTPYPLGHRVHMSKTVGGGAGLVDDFTYGMGVR